MQVFTVRAVSGRPPGLAIRIANDTHPASRRVWRRPPHRRRPLALAAAASLAVLAWAVAPAATTPSPSPSPTPTPTSTSTPTVESHFAALAADLDPRTAPALASIDGLDRRLLAARSYLRSARTLALRWSWSAADLERWAGSDAQRRHDAAVARVACEFEAANPGYTLRVNPRLRTLEEQVAHWNANASVAAAAGRLGATLATATSAPRFPAADSPAGRAAFRRLLVEHVPEPTPTLAAPGLSLHGRMQAVDFHVVRDGGTVAGPDAASVTSVWRDGGWEARLRAAIDAADAGFVGPLRSPDEPWHYDWTDAPRSAAAAAPADDACRRAG
jgi:hypothetical protein